MDIHPKKILLVDDNPAIHEDFRKILAKKSDHNSLDETYEQIFNKRSTTQQQAKEDGIVLESAYQGQDAVKMVKQAVHDNKPYALAFVDVRMPPGWDGIKTIKKIWEIDQDIQMVICTAYSDYTLEEISEILHGSDNLLILKKPFDIIEVRQLISTLTKKWDLNHEIKSHIGNLEEKIAAATVDLKKINENLTFSLRLNECTLEATQEGILVLNQDKNILIYNQKFRTLWNLSEVINKQSAHSLFMKISEQVKGPQDFFAQLLTICERENNENMLELELNSGRVFELFAHSFSFQANKNMRGLVLSFRDITENRRLQEEDEVIRKSNKELEQFAYVVSHDLKAPLRGIAGIARIIQEDYHEKLDEEGLNYLDLLASRVHKLESLIEGILQYSRAGRSTEEKKLLDLNQMVQEVIILLSPPQQIKISIENTLPTIHCEKIHMWQIFQNLLSNAIKYNDKEKGVISIGSTNKEKEWLFWIKDNGIGIDKKYSEKIFELFQTINPNTSGDSTGIGLSTAKKIVKLYGGNIWFESELGKGSTFYFTLNKRWLN